MPSPETQNKKYIPPILYEKRFLVFGILLSLGYHFFILLPVMRNMDMEPVLLDYSSEEETAFILEDIVIPTRKKKVKKNIPNKVITKKLRYKKPEKKKAIPDKKKIDKHKKSKDVQEPVKAQDYKKVPWIEPKQKFTIKKNKKPKLPPKGSKEGSEAILKNDGATLGTGSKMEAKKHIGVLKTPQKLKKKAGVLGVEKGKHFEALLSAPPSLNKKSTPKKPIEKPHAKLETGKKYSLWDTFSSEDFKTERKAKAKPIIEEMPKLSMLNPPQNSFLRSDSSSEKLLDGSLFNLEDLRGGGGIMGSLGKKKGYSFGSLSIGDEDFKNEWYARVIVGKVAHNWYPPGIAYLGASGVTVVSFSITRSGKAIKIRVSRKSKNRPIDESASNAVKLSNDFPELPEDYLKDKLDIRFTFYVNVRPAPVN